MLTTHPRTAAPAVPAHSTMTAAPALFMVAVVASVAWGPVALVLVAALAPATIAAIVDAATGRLPDRLIIAAAAPTALVLAAEAAAGRLTAAVGALALGAVLFAGPLLAIHLAMPSAMGYGDVKLAAVVGGALAMIEPRAAIVALFVASGATLAVAVVHRRGSLPFGPGIVIGAGVVIVLAALTGRGLWPWR